MSRNNTEITVPTRAIPDSERVEVKDIFSKIDEYEASLPQSAPAEEPETVVKPVPLDTVVNDPVSTPTPEPTETTEEIVRRLLNEERDILDSTCQEPVTIERPKTSWFWIKNSNGESSASITFLYIAFWVTTVMFILGHIGEINIGDKNITFNQFDSTAAAVYYIPLMMLYFKRREFESDKPGRPGLLELALTKNNQNNNGQ